MATGQGVKQTLVETAPQQIFVGDPLWLFATGIILTAVFCALLSVFYTHFGTSLSNRRNFSRNFVVIGMTTMLVLTIVKSSIALSLGLVGALSIVRFRTAIKEPEELGYLFLTLGIGLGFGAGYKMWGYTVFAYALILIVLFIKHKLDSEDQSSNLYLMIRGDGQNRPSIDKLADVLTPSCKALSLKRYDDSNDGIEAAFQVAFEDVAQLEQARQAVQALGENLQISFVDNDGIV